MTDTDILLKNKKMNTKRLLSYGFVKKEENYIYSEKLINGQLEMTVIITKTGKLSAEIRDTASKELYIVHKVSGSYGGFVGKVREEHIRILNDIIKNCFDNDTFKSEYSKLVIRYVKDICVTWLLVRFQSVGKPDVLSTYPVFFRYGAYSVSLVKDNFLPAYVADKGFLVLAEDQAVSSGQHSVKFKFFRCKAGNAWEGTDADGYNFCFRF